MTRKTLTTIVLPVLLLATASVGLAGEAGKEFRSAWFTDAERTWIGPEYWANRLQDWRISAGRLECVRSGQDRNVHLLTRQLGDRAPVGRRIHRHPKPDPGESVASGDDEQLRAHRVRSPVVAVERVDAVSIPFDDKVCRPRDEEDLLPGHGDHGSGGGSKRSGEEGEGQGDLAHSVSPDCEPRSYRRRGSLVKW